MSATFTLDGQEFMALNGGPLLQFSPAISFFVNCETQQEVDDLWDKLSDEGKKDRCGWLTDKFGLLANHPIGARTELSDKILRSLDASCKPCCRWTRSRSKAEASLRKIRDQSHHRLAMPGAFQAAALSGFSASP